MNPEFFASWLRDQPLIVQQFVRENPSGRVAKAAIREARAAFRKQKRKK